MSKKFRNFRVKYQESSIGFEHLAYLQSIENKCNRRWSSDFRGLFAIFFIIMESTISKIYSVDTYGQLHLELSTAICRFLQKFDLSGVKRHFPQLTKISAFLSSLIL